MAKNPQQINKSLTKQGFEALYHHFALPLFKFLIKRMGGDKDAAEEVFSQTVVAAWKSFHTFESKSTYFTWICSIALNKIADYYRTNINERSRWIAPGLEELAKIKNNDLTPEEKLLLKELRESVRECLMLLPHEKRQLLWLRYWKDMTISKIAKILGISERSAEGKIYRAKLELRGIFLEKYPEYFLDSLKK